VAHEMHCVSEKSQFNRVIMSISAKSHVYETCLYTIRVRWPVLRWKFDEEQSCYNTTAAGVCSIATADTYTGVVSILYNWPTKYRA